MEEVLKTRETLISCSNNHAVAIGAYGQLYVWGKNTLRFKESDPNESIDDPDLVPVSDRNNPNALATFEEPGNQLGIVEDSMPYIEKPIYYSFTHPLYRINASQAVCGPSFTVVIGKEKLQPLEGQDPDTESFLKEIDDRCPEIVPPHLLGKERDLVINQIRSNKIRQEITEFLQSCKLDFMSYFRSRIIKEQSFLDIMTNEVRTLYSHAELSEFITYKKMRLPGNGISLLPLYELVNKCKQGNGVLYLLGSENMVPKISEIMCAKYISKYSLGYYLISLPDSVCCAKVCCGETFVLILSTNGVVYSWGSVCSPALGKNRFPSYNSIKPVQGLVNNEYSKVVDIACGNSHCLAMTSTGIILSWGNGDYGKLGIGRLENSSRPEIVNLDSHDPESVKCGHNSSYCKTKDGLSFVWGEANNGKFLTESFLSLDRPQVPGFEFEVTDIAIGRNYCVYVDTQGLLYQCGDDKEICLSKNYKHLEGAEFYQVAACEGNFFALSTKGSIYSWSVVEGRTTILGREVNKDQDIPIELTTCSQQFPVKNDDEAAPETTVKDGSNKIVKVMCGDKNTVLVTEKGEGLIAGNNAYGQMAIAYGDIEDEEDQADKEDFYEFVRIPRLSMAFKMSISAIACGYRHMLAINNKGRAYSWGANECGQLGLKTFFHSQKYPAPICGLEDDVTIVKLAAGNSHSMVLTEDGDVYVFGSAERGKLGLGNISSSAMVSVPTKIMKLEKVTHISCNEGHSLAVSKGKLYTWGDGWCGQLGNGKKDTVYEPIPLLSPNEWKSGCCGASHSLGITTQKRVFHWGAVNNDEDESDFLLPVIVKGLEEVQIKEVFAANGHSAALVDSGSAVYIWGTQLYKRLLGVKPEIKDNCRVKISNFSVSGEKIMSFSIGNDHGCLVTDQGNVFTWGCTINGRLGESISNAKSKAYNQIPTSLSKFSQKNGKKDEVPSTEENILDLQFLLQNEPEELNEANIREVDKQIAAKFNECVDKFIDLTEADKSLEAFFIKTEHKMLTRLQQEPLRCRLTSENRSTKEEITDNLIGYGSMITTYQIHTCYMYKLMCLKIRDEKKLELLDMIYCDLEREQWLLYTSIYLSRMLLAKLLKCDDIEFRSLLNDPKALLYKALINKIIVSSESDMEKLRKLAESSIQNLGNIVHDDVNGIDPNPLNNAKTTTATVSNKITAYQMNRNLVDRRMAKLKQVMQYFIDSLRKFYKEEDFSENITILVNDFLTNCTERFDLKVKQFDPLMESVREVTHVILSFIFKPLVQAVKSPFSFYVLVENKEASSPENLASLSSAIEAFFAGTELGNKAERWYSEINEFNLNHVYNTELKVEILEKILKNKPDLEELFLTSIFEHSLSTFDKQITVPGRGMIYLHSVTSQHLEELRVNNPSYDPLILLCKELGSVPHAKSFSQSEGLNLKLYTRSLRQDQSIVRCPYCEMLVPRDMAPSNFKPIIELYDPMPPNSPSALLTKILASGCKKIRLSRIDDYLKQYETNFGEFIKDFESAEMVSTLINLVDTIFAASAEIIVDTSDPEQRQFIDKGREVYLRGIEKDCENEYLRRKHHSVIQHKLTNTFNSLIKLLSKKQRTSKIGEKVQKVLMFNLEYGGSNRDLERFSDNVMFSIYLNTIREYTSKKQMSLNLYENLTDGMKESLRGFMKRSLTEFISKKIVKEWAIPMGMTPKDILFSFEIDNEFLTIIVAYSKSRMNLCGRDEFREEELLMYEKISSENIAEMREEMKSNEEDKLIFLPYKPGNIKLGFSQNALLEIAGKMEDKISAYIQNINIAMTHKVKSKKSKNKKEDEDMEKTKNLN